jgi:DNA-binding CsgD family transcriptional regulator/tetratricopeptide (TPR) repeat protein
MLLGRIPERSAIERFLDDVTAWPAALVLEGGDGIGKTTLWAAGVDHARRNRLLVVESRCSGREGGFAFSTLGDLADGFPSDTFEMLPAPQRSALDAVLLRRGDPEVDAGPRALGVAFLGLLRAAADESPLLVALDDVERADPDSARILGFALRRLRTEPVGVLATTSSDPDGTFLAELTSPPESVLLAPVPLDDLADILHAHTGVRLDRTGLRRVSEVSGGNPFFAIEVVRSMERGDPVVTGLAVPIPRGPREDLIRQRSATLSEPARELLLLTAAAGTTSRSLLGRAFAQPGIRGGSRDREDDTAFDGPFEEAERAGLLVDQGGVVRVAHPLDRSAAYGDASRSHRCAVHAALAAVVDDPEERARHLALASPGQDGEVAADLEAAAAVARLRGAAAGAQDLLELCVRRTPPQDTEALARRLTRLALARSVTGDVAGSLTVADEAVATAATSPTRSDALLCRALLTADRGSLGAARRDLVEVRGLEASTVSAAVLVATAWVACDLGLGAEATASVGAAIAVLEGSRDARAAALLERWCALYGLQLEARRTPTPRVEGEPSGDDEGVARVVPPRHLDDAIEAEAGLYRGLDPSPLLVGLGERALQASDLPTWCWAERTRGEWALRSGDVAAALELVESCRQTEERVGFSTTATERVRGGAVALRGDDEEARRILADVAVSADPDDAATGWRVAGHLGRLELSLGRPEEAAAILGPAIDGFLVAGIGEPGYVPVLADGVEAALAVGDRERAERCIAWLEGRADLPARPDVQRTIARCRGLLAGAQDRTPEAIGLLESALSQDAGDRIEDARTRLLRGRMLLRAGKWKDARSVLLAGRSAFDLAGAALWLRRVDDELAHIPGRRPAPGPLTDAERRVARLAAAGMQNREIADQLHLSVRTVESHLARVYPKLGVRSRTELALFFDRPA